LTLAFWRVLVAGLVLLPLARPMPRREAWLTLLGGLFLALHFWTWFESLHRTSVMRSTLLVCTTPIWAGILEGLVLRQPPGRRFWAGIGVALIGLGLLVAASEPGAGTSEKTGPAWTGDALAILGGMLGASYFTLGRRVRAVVPIGSYGPVSCLATAAWLAALAVLVDAPLFGFEMGGWLPILGLAAGPQLLGHLGINYAVGRLPAAIVAGVILLEPLAATLVAAGVLGEVPGGQQIAGGVVMLVGVGIAVLPVPARVRAQPADRERPVAGPG
jgi:drug/metabolite transporter (DMT)-like permease